MTFGSLSLVLGDGKSVSLGYDKARALVVFLAVEADRPHRRESLAGLLWPDRPEERARQSLSQALYHLRQEIEPDGIEPSYLLANSQTIQFNPASSYDLDATAFMALADLLVPPLSGGIFNRANILPLIQCLEEAIGLYSGPFLAGFTLQDAPAFEEWIVLQRGRFHRLAMRACSRLVELFADENRFDLALRYARRQIELDPWREMEHQQVMQLLALSGRRSEALNHYEACRQLLAEGLQIEPAADTIRLYEMIRSEELGGCYEINSIS